MTEPESTTTRRDLLGILLSRVERGVITDRERPLLRPLVEAEMAEPDAVRAEAQQQYEALMERFNDLRTETLRQGEIHDRSAATVERQKELLGALRGIVFTASECRDASRKPACGWCDDDHVAELTAAFAEADAEYAAAASVQDGEAGL